MTCLNQIYYIYTRFSHLIYGFSVAYIAKGAPVQKMMLMKFINQMESCTELYWTKKRSMLQFWIHWWWWRWEKVIESNGGDILFTHPFPWVSLFLFWLSLIRIRRRLKKNEHDFAQWKKKIEWNPMTNDHQRLTINKIHKPRTTVHRPLTTDHQ